MKRFSPARWLALALCATLLAGGAAAAPEKTPAAALVAGGNFIPPDSIDWKTVLPPPPAAGSVAALGDLETVLQVQATRTPADIAWAKLTEQDDIYADFGDVLGLWFEEKSLPVLADFLRQVTADVQLVNKRVKDLYLRQRPPAVEPTVQPCVKIPTSNSYPSGHSLRAYVWAAVLGDVFSDRQVELYTRAHRVAWGRVIGGVHFPSDDIGGRMVAQAIVAELRKSPAYRAAIGKCRAEAAPFLLKKAA
ncbi:MAG: phosphatase PAP2 family protein [Opitutales bacterium]